MIRRRLSGLLAATFLSVLAAVAASGGEAAAQTVAERAIQAAGALLEKGQAMQAAEQLQAVEGRATGAEQARVKNALGYTLFSSGQEDAAVGRLEEARVLAREAGDRETLVKATNNLGVLEFTRGNLDAARAAFDTTAAMGSDFAADYLTLIAEQEKARQVEALIAAGVEAVREKQDFAAAIDSYSRALEVDPQNPDALNFRGYARYRLDELDAAEADLERAFGAHPESTTLRINLLKVRCKLDKPLASEFGPRTPEEAETFAGDGELKRICGKRLAEVF